MNATQEAYVVTIHHVDMDAHLVSTLGVYSTREKAQSEGEAYRQRMKAIAAEPPTSCPKDGADEYRTWTNQVVRYHRAKSFCGFFVNKYAMDACWA